MIYILSFILSIWIVILWMKKRMADALTLLLVCALGFFEINLSFFGFDYLLLRAIGQNVVFFSSILLGVYQLTQRRVKKSNTRDIEKSILFLLIYSTAISLLTILRGKETPFNVIALMKPVLVFYFFFIFKSLKPKDIAKTIRRILKYTLLIGIITIIQIPLGINVFGTESFETSAGIARFWSPYFTATLGLFFTMVSKRNKLNSSFIFFLFLVFLPLRRGLIISSTLTLFIYYVYRFRHGGIPRHAYIVVVLGLLSLPILMGRFNSDGDNAKEDVTSVFSGNTDYSTFVNGKTGGTFAFRIAVLLERLDYLSDNPKELLFGVGMLHEDTAQKKFKFFLGSYKTVSGERIPQQIDTTDISWPPILMRLGLIGVFLYLIIFIHILRHFLLQRRKTSWALVGAAYLFNYLIFSFADAELTQIYSILFYLLLLQIVTNQRIMGKKALTHKSLICR